MLQMHMVWPHRLIYFALKWIKIIQQYYGRIWSKSFQEFSPSSWHHHQRGIFIGCTVSIVLFLAAINITIEFTLSLKDSFMQEHRIGMKAFMDDLSVMSSCNHIFLQPYHFSMVSTNPGIFIIGRIAENFVKMLSSGFNKKDLPELAGPTIITFLNLPRPRLGNFLIAAAKTYTFTLFRDSTSRAAHPEHKLPTVFHNQWHSFLQSVCEWVVF